MQQDLGLGRLYEPDSRDAPYRFGIVIPPDYPPIIRKKTWTPPPIWNQGQTGTCVGHGCACTLGATPYKHTGDPFSIYDLATTLDGFPDNDHNPNSGTTVRAGMKAMEQMGFLKSYVWAYSAKEVANWILRRGPVVIGIPWYSGMSGVNVDGYVTPNGSNVGGHCVCVYGANVNTQTLLLQNSWGPGWGRGGRFKMTFDVLDNLLSDHGECCAAVERKLVI